jgi:hypothetical protein
LSHSQQETSLSKPRSSNPGTLFDDLKDFVSKLMESENDFCPTCRAILRETLKKERER